VNQPSTTKAESGQVYCPMCTHTVEAWIQTQHLRRAVVKPGQKCPRCAGSLDAGYIFATSITTRRAA
jgi:hypothetical protein